MKGIHHTNSQIIKITQAKHKSLFAYACIIFYFMNVFKENSHYTESGIIPYVFSNITPFPKYEKTSLVLNFTVFRYIF